MINFTIGDYQVIILQKVLTKLISFSQNDMNNSESGGVLICKLFSSKILQIEDMTEPQYEDRKSRYSFFRSKKHCDILVSKWNSSGHILSLAGTWHTHPEDEPEPSQADIRDWKQTIRNKKGDNCILIFIIIGILKTKLWYGTPDYKIHYISKVLNEHY